MAIPLETDGACFPLLLWDSDDDDKIHRNYPQTEVARAKIVFPLSLVHCTTV